MYVGIFTYSGHDGFQLIVPGERRRRVVHHAAIIVTNAECVSDFRGGLIKIVLVTYMHNAHDKNRISECRKDKPRPVVTP